MSLCLTGRTQVPTGVEHIGFRLLDEGKTVLPYCVPAHSRTPTVAIAHAMVRGVPRDEAIRSLCASLPAARPNRAFRNALKRIPVSRRGS